MDSERKRVGAAKNGVTSGSVWETRMKNDDVKGGFKVFNADQNSQENLTSSDQNNNNNNNNNEIQVYKRLRPKQGVVVAAGVSSGKRKTWKSDNSEGFEKSPVQISKQRSSSEKEKHSDEKLRELSLSAADGIKKSPVQISKQRSEKEENSDDKCSISVLADGIKKSPVHQIKKTRSDGVEEFDRSPIHRMRTRAMWQRLSGDSGDQNSISLRKLKSSPGVDESEGSPGLRKSKSEKKSIEMRNADVIEEIEKVEIEIKKAQSAQSLEEFDASEEKLITTDLNNIGQIKPPKFEETDDDDEDEEDDWEDDEMVDGNEKKSIVVKQMNLLSPKEQKSTPPIDGNQISVPTNVVSDKKIVQRNERTPPISTMVKKQVPPPVVNHPRFISNNTSTNPTYSGEEFDEPQKATRTHSKLQSLVDLVMWRDASKSALIFGVGAFSIISSSFTKDLNISFISVISYMGLVYLAAIFLFRSIIKRGAVDTDDTNQNHVVGEEEAIWILKLMLPYINEFLLNVRALFSGDPATTMKLAVLLFVLARCGSSITIWKMAKLGFFGVFTVPKICSSYSSQLTAFGTFWIRRFRDAWESCTHKKAVGFAIFTVVWNLSSVIARIWAVFMLFVAFKYYQQSLIREEWSQEDATNTVTRGGQDSWQGQRQGRNGPTFLGNSQNYKKNEKIKN